MIANSDDKISTKVDSYSLPDESKYVPIEKVTIQFPDYPNSRDKCKRCVVFDFEYDISVDPLLNIGILSRYMYLVTDFKNEKT